MVQATYKLLDRERNRRKTLKENRESQTAITTKHFYFYFFIQKNLLLHFFAWQVIGNDAIMKQQQPSKYTLIF